MANFLGPSLDQVEGALWLNRPREAIAVLEQLDPTDPFFGRIDYWDLLHDAHHILGNYEQALEAAARGRAQYPNSPRVLLYDVETLAALGRLEDVDQRLGEVGALPPQPGVSVGNALWAAAAEFRAHGHREAVRTVFARIWDLDRPPPDSSAPEQRYGFAYALYVAGRLEDARQRCTQLIDEGMSGTGVRELLGLIAGRQGDRAEALRISDWLRDLDEPYLYGFNTLSRARIAAALGDQEQAVTLLREAFAQGNRFGMWVHQDIVLQSLRDYPPFQELVRPKG
jgi:tetratricopeptide (TPR) repeat protein